MHDRTSKALGTVETSNHSYQAKAPVKATRTKMNGTFLLKCLAAFCMLGNVTASPTPICGCSEAVSALRVEFQAKYDAQQALIDYVANEVQDVRECSACVSPSPPPPSPSPPPPSPPPPPRCSSVDGYPTMTLKSWYLDHTNGGSEKWAECEELCRADPSCHSWMGRNPGLGYSYGNTRTCYLSVDRELKPNPYDDGSHTDHHPHTLNAANCLV